MWLPRPIFAIAVVLACVQLVYGASVQYVGSSGKVILTPGANSNRWIMISLSKLEEIYPTGTSVGWSTPALASQTFTWSPATTVLLGGVNATEVTLTANLTVTGNAAFQSTGYVQLQVITHVVEQLTTVQFANQTVQVPKDTVKYTVKITGWPWQDPTHYLRFGVSATTKSTGVPTLSSDGTKVSLPDNCIIEMVPNGLADGTTATPVTTTVKYVSPGYEVQWLFPYFATSMEYDPILSIGSASVAIATAINWMSALVAMTMLFISL